MKLAFVILFYLITQVNAEATGGSSRPPEGGSKASDCDRTLTGSKLNDVPATVWNLEIVKTHPDLHQTYLKMKHIPIWGDWARAVQKLEQIKAAVARTDADERPAWEKIARLAEAAVTKHQLVFVKDQHPEDLLVGNHVAVLKAIASFDAAHPLTSLFGINRAVKTTKSTKEYLICR